MCQQLKNIKENPVKKSVSTPLAITDAFFGSSSRGRALRFALWLSLSAMLAVTVIACGGGGVEPQTPSGNILLSPVSTLGHPILSSSYPSRSIPFTAAEQGYGGAFTATLGAQILSCGGGIGCLPHCSFVIQTVSATEFKATGECVGFNGGSRRPQQAIVVRDSLGHRTIAYVQ